MHSMYLAITNNLNSNSSRMRSLFFVCGILNVLASSTGNANMSDDGKKTAPIDKTLPIVAGIIVLAIIGCWIRNCRVNRRNKREERLAKLRREQQEADDNPFVKSQKKLIRLLDLDKVGLIKKNEALELFSNGLVKYEQELTKKNFEEKVPQDQQRKELDKRFLHYQNIVLHKLESKPSLSLESAISQAVDEIKANPLLDGVKADAGGSISISPEVSIPLDCSDCGIPREDRERCNNLWGCAF